MKTLSSIVLTCFLFFFQSCSENDKECNGICTLEYRTIVVEIKDSEGQPVVLDSFKVEDLSSGRDLTMEPDDSSFMRERGFYPIFSDRYSQEYKQLEIDLRFTGYIDGLEVVNEVYKVGADCCHVYYIAGNLELVL